MKTRMAFLAYLVAGLVFLLPACDNGSASQDGPNNDSGVESDTGQHTDAGSDIDATSETDSGADIDSGNDTPTDGWEPRFDPFVEALIQDLEASHAYGVSAAIMENGVVTFAAAFGLKDPNYTDPLTPDTLMQIGSTTKQMTAVGLLQKAQEGLVALDDTLNEVLPELELALDGTWVKEITMHHLLSHQGGFFDLVPWGGRHDDPHLANYTYNEFANEIFVMNPPGIFYNYSNPNFSLAGLVTQTLDTRPWPDIMLEDVFLPLGMERSFLRKSEVEADGDFAVSFGLGLHTLRSGTLGYVQMDEMPDPAWVRPAGLAWTTPTQMMTWAKFLMDGDEAVLSDELRTKMVEEQVDTLYGAGSMFYGYGMFLHHGLSQAGQWFEIPIWEHGGNTLSFSHFFYILPEQKMAMAICASGMNVDFSASIDKAITTLVELPQPSSQPPQYEIDPNKLDDHVGTYHDPYIIGDIIVTRDDNRLKVEIPSVEANRYNPTLIAISSDLFILQLDGTPLDLTFIRTEPEGPSTFIRNRLFVVTRVNEDAPQARPMPKSDQVSNWLDRIQMERLPGPARYLKLPAAAQPD